MHQLISWSTCLHPACQRRVTASCRNCTWPTISWQTSVYQCWRATHTSAFCTWPTTISRRSQPGKGFLLPQDLNSVPEIQKERFAAAKPVCLLVLTHWLLLLSRGCNNTGFGKTHFNSRRCLSRYPLVKWPSWRSWRRWTWVETCWRLCPPPSWTAGECTHSSPTPTPSRFFQRSCSWWRWKWASSNSGVRWTCSTYDFLRALTRYSYCCQCVDLSCNELSEITLPENLPPKLQELDLTGNPRLNLDHKTLEQLKYVFFYVFLCMPLCCYVSFYVSTRCSVLQLYRVWLFFPATFAASALIRLQPFRQTRHLVGPLCGVMVTQRPRASRTSEFGLMEERKTAAVTLVWSEVSLIQISWERALLKRDDSNEKKILERCLLKTWITSKTSLGGINLPIQYFYVHPEEEIPALAHVVFTFPFRGYVGNRQTLMSFCSTVTWIIESIISLVMFVECYDQCMNTGLISSLFLPQWHYRPPFACSLLRLCVAALSVNSFCGSREALYGVFDGDRNVEVPYLLQCTMNDVLAEELHKTKSEEDYMTNTFLVMQRYTISYVSFSVNYLLTTSVYY